jgi:hypothetical protein
MSDTPMSAGLVGSHTHTIALQAAYESLLERFEMQRSEVSVPPLSRGLGEVVLYASQISPGGKELELPTASLSDTIDSKRKLHGTHSQTVWMKAASQRYQTPRSDKGELPGMTLLTEKPVNLHYPFN